MQEICSPNPPVLTGICDLNKSRARHHRSLKLGSKLKYFNHNMMNQTLPTDKSEEKKVLNFTSFENQHCIKLLQVHDILEWCFKKIVYVSLLS